MPDEAPPTIRVSKNGPYLVKGGLPMSQQIIVSDESGTSQSWRECETFEHKDVMALCRCGHSGNKPYCDGTHAKIGFDGTETASRAAYLERAEEIDGPLELLTDAEDLCAFARFCDRGGQVWNLVTSDNKADADLAVQEAELCPSGRLVAWDRSTKQPHETDYPPSIGVVEDPVEGVSGPLWVRGSVQVIGADGEGYEIRARQTLCRCGESGNKPFCDGTHASIGFKDGLPQG